MLVVVHLIVNLEFSLKIRCSLFKVVPRPLAQLIIYSIWEDLGRDLT